MSEDYKGVGRKDRRSMIKRWKDSGSKLSLKQWARKQGVGDVADVWLRSKQ